jgi:flagellar basal-body rod modification protein FlgD
MSTTPIGSATTTAPQTAAQASTGLNLTSTDFVKMMIKQLQHQDPLSPTNSDQLMQQMSQIGQMQSSTQLQTTLTGLAAQTQIGAASSLIGKQVSGLDSINNPVTGLVTSVQVSSGGVNLQLDTGGALPLANVAAISPGTTAATAQGVVAPTAAQ